MSSISEYEESERKFLQRAGLASCPLPWLNIIARDTWKTRAAEMPELLRLCKLECGGHGDCLFHSIARALSQSFGENITFQHVRDWAASAITPENVDHYLKKYLNEEETGWRLALDQYHKRRQQGKLSRQEMKEGPMISARFLPGEWVPSNLVKTEAAQRGVEDRAAILQLIMRTPGNVHRGDDITLELLTRGRLPFGNIGYIVLVDNGTISCAVHDVRDRTGRRITDYYILLYNFEDSHWQLAGLLMPEGYDPPVRSVFRVDELPRVITDLFTADCLSDAVGFQIARNDPGSIVYEQQSQHRIWLVEMRNALANLQRAMLQRNITQGQRWKSEVDRLIQEIPRDLEEDQEAAELQQLAMEMMF